MKKFKFSLDSVLSYKEQVLEALQGEHAVILAEVRAQEEVLEAAWQEYRDCDLGVNARDYSYGAVAYNSRVFIREASRKVNFCDLGKPFLGNYCPRTYRKIAAAV